MGAPLKQNEQNTKGGHGPGYLITPPLTLERYVYGLHVTLYVYDTHNALHKRYTVRVRRNACNERNATDVCVAICTKACYGFNAIALTQHLRRCDTSLARVVDNATVYTCVAHNGLRIRYTQRYVYAIHALTVSCGYQTQPTYGGLLQLVPCVAHAWFSQLAGTFPKPQTRLPA